MPPQVIENLQNLKLATVQVWVEPTGLSRPAIYCRWSAVEVCNTMVGGYLGAYYLLAWME